MAKKELKRKKGFECLSVTSVEVFPLSEGEAKGKLLGVANVVLNDQLCIRGLRIMDGVNGMFVGYPNDPFYKGEDLRSIVFPIKRVLREHIENCVLEKYLYKTGKANVKFNVTLTHPVLLGACVQSEIIAANKTEAVSKAKENALEFIPSTKDKGEWKILKVKKHA